MTFQVNIKQQPGKMSLQPASLTLTEPALKGSGALEFSSCCRTLYQPPVPSGQEQHPVQDPPHKNPSFLQTLPRSSCNSTLQHQETLGPVDSILLKPQESIPSSLAPSTFAIFRALITSRSGYSNVLLFPVFLCSIQPLIQ